MQRKIKFTLTADLQYAAREAAPSKTALFEQVRKAIGHQEIDLHHSSFNAHAFTSLSGENGEKVFEASAQNTLLARIGSFGITVPMKPRGKKRVPVITIVAITRHP
jgi:hypothetical protein